MLPCRVLPLIEVAMAENCTSTAFSSADLEAAREPARVELSQTLTAVAQAFGGGQLCCTCVSWSSTGKHGRHWGCVPLGWTRQRVKSEEVTTTGLREQQASSHCIARNVVNA